MARMAGTMRSPGDTEAARLQRVCDKAVEGRIDGGTRLGPPGPCPAAGRAPYRRGVGNDDELARLEAELVIAQEELETARRADDGSPMARLSITLAQSKVVNLKARISLAVSRPPRG